MAKKKNWIPKDLKKGRCTPAPNPDCPVDSPQYNLAQTFKKHHGFHKKEEGGTIKPLMPDGGKLQPKTKPHERKPFIVTDPKDRKLQAYNDSLVAYNNNELFYSNMTKATKNAKTADEARATRIALSKKYPLNSIKPIMQDMATAPVLVDRPDLRYTLKRNTEFKKPVQPVVYQKPQQASAQQNKPTYQDSLNVFNLDKKIANEPFTTFEQHMKRVGDLKDLMDKAGIRPLPFKHSDTDGAPFSQKLVVVPKLVIPQERKDYPLRGPLPKAQANITIQSPQQEQMPVPIQQPTNWSFTYPGQGGMEQQYFNSQAEYDNALKQAGSGQPIGNNNFMGSKQEGNVYSSQFKTKPQYGKGGKVSPEKAKEILHDGTVYGHSITEKQRKFFGAMSNKKAAWGASLGTDPFVGGPGPVNPYPQGFKIPKLDAMGNPIPETPSIPNTIPVTGQDPTWQTFPNSPAQTTSSAPPVSPDRAKYQKMDPMQTGTAAPNIGEGQLNRGQMPNLTPGQQQYDKQAIPIKKSPDLKAPQATGLQGSGGQAVLTGLMLVDAVMKKEKIRRRYVRPEDTETYNPNVYGTGSQALSEYGNTLKGKKKEAFWGAILSAAGGKEGLIKEGIGAVKSKGPADVKNAVNNLQESAAPILMTSALGQAEADRINNLYTSGGVQNMANLQSPMAALPGQQFYPYKQYNPNSVQYMADGGQMGNIQTYYEQGKDYHLDDVEIERLKKLGYKLQY